MKILKFASTPSLKLRPFAIVNRDDKIVHVEQAELIRLISQAFRVPYEIDLSEGLSYGKKMPNGSWTGILGLLSRSKVDLAVFHIGLTEEMRDDFNVCYPHEISDFTFMANKPKPLSDDKAIFYPFSFEVWISIALCMVIVTLLLCYLLKKKRAFFDIFFMVCGSLLENSMDFEIRNFSLRILLIMWLIAVLVLNSGYKGTLLSFLTLPTMVGIRDISDLSKAAVENSVKCFAYADGSSTIQSLIDSNIDAWMPIANCVIRSHRTRDEDFSNAKGNKVFITKRSFLYPYERQYFISKDSFFSRLGFVYYSKNFCCPEYLNDLIHRFYATGLNLKYRGDERFHTQLHVNSYNHEDEPSEKLKKLSLSYLSGAFFVLLSGWFLGCITLLVEILVNKYSQSHRRKAKISPLFLNTN